MLKFSFKKIYPFAKAFVLALFCCIFLCAFSFIFIKQNNKNVSLYAQANESAYSQEYINYLNSLEEDKENYGVIPRMYDINISSLYSSSSYQNLLSSNNLPTEYSLYYIDRIYWNFNNENRSNFAYLPKNVGNQKSTNICWTFASLTAFESTLYKLGVVNTSTPLNFSELNLAYISQVQNHGVSTIGGGTFDLAYEYLGYNLGPVNEQSGESFIFSSNASSADIDTQTEYVNSYLSNATKAGYSALEAYYYPSRSSCTTESQKADLRNSIKNHIYTYGAVTSAIAYSSQYYSSISQSKYFCNTSSADTINHLITLVGWDDNFEIQYHGEVLTGAYIAQNSWGESWGNNGYFYIMYDDAKVEENVSGFVRVSQDLSNAIDYNNFEETIYENNYITFNGDYSYYQYLENSSNIILANFFEVSQVSNQYISRIKIPTVISRSYEPSNFYVYVLPNLTSANVLTQNSIQNYLSNNFSSAIKLKNKNSTGSDEYLFTSCQVGFYTIDVNQQINLESNFFGILIEYISSPIYFRDNVDGVFDSISSKQRTYISSNNGVNWGLLETQNGSNVVKEILPVMVQTNYLLNQIEYEAANISQIYDASNVTFNVNVSNLNQNDYTIYYSLTGNEEDYYTTLNIKDAGSYKVYFKILADFYIPVLGQDKFFNVQIFQRPLNIEPAEQYNIYGNSDSIFDFTYSNNIRGENPKFFGSLSREAGSDVGLYNIIYNPANFYLQDNGSFKKDNYIISFVENVKYEIKPRTLLITPISQTKTYGSSDPTTFNYVLVGAVNGEIPMYQGNLLRESGENVGKYNLIEDLLNPIEIFDNGSFKKDNYELYLNPNNQAFEITKKLIIVTPDSNLEKIYGASDPVFTFTHTGEVYGEEAAFYGFLMRESGEDVGQYEILLNEDEFYLIDNGSFIASNYNIYLTPSVMFTINYGLLTNCVFESLTVNYDGNAHYLIAENNYIPNVTITYSLQEDGVYSQNLIGYKNVKVDEALNTIPYTVFAKFESPNYNSVIKQANLTINKINILVTPQQNQSKIYDGDANISNILFNYSGQVQGETPTFTGSLSCQNISKNVNDYLIINNNLQLTSSQTFNKNNYNLVFDNSQNIVFSILERQITIIPLEDQCKYYGNSDRSLSLIVENLVKDEVPNYQGSLSREDGESVGQYLITIGSLVLNNSDSFDESNYQISFNNSIYFNILKSNITIKVEDVHCYYGHTPTFSYLIADENAGDGTYVDGDNLNVVYSCAVTPKTKRNDSNVDYTIYAQANNSNYNISIIYGQYFVEYEKYNVYVQVLQQRYALPNQIEHFSYVSNEDLLEIETQAKQIEGYKFNFWKIESVDENGNSTGSYKRYLNTQDYIQNETTIVADMEEVEYTATFYTNSEQTQNYSFVYTINSSDYVFESPLKKGYTFVYWYYIGNSTEYSATKLEKGSTGNKSFYAKWQINLYKINLPEDSRVSFEYDNTLQINEDIKVEYQKSFIFKVNLLSAYSKSNFKVLYLIKGDTNITELTKNLETNEFNIDNIENEITIYIENITINTYSINFIIDKEVKKTLTKNHGESVLTSEYPSIPQKTNYNNTEPIWSISQIESVEKDEDIVAIYIPNVYNITFVVDDGKTYSTTVTYGENVTDDILRENYNLNFFEYFDYDTNFFGVDEDTIINVKIKSNIYILYIVLASIAVVITLTTIVLIIRKKSKSKLKWWAYVKNPNNKNIKK